MAAPAPAGEAQPEAFGGGLARVDGELDANIAPEFYAAFEDMPSEPTYDGYALPYAAGFAVDIDDSAYWDAPNQYGIDGPGLVEPLPLNFELPEGFVLTSASGGIGGNYYSLSHGEGRTISLLIDHVSDQIELVEREFIEGDRFNQMQLGGQTIHYQPDYTQAALIVFIRDDLFYYVSGCSDTTLEDLLLLAQAIISG